jgi:hypothetical protein
LAHIPPIFKQQQKMRNSMTQQFEKTAVYKIVKKNKKFQTKS